MSESSKGVKFDLEAAQVLCRELPIIADRLMRAGLFQTAHRMREPIRSIGFEVCDLLEGQRKPVDRAGRRISWREP